MATIDLGKIKIVWRGTYAGGTAYTPDDAVVHSGTSYICIANTTGNAPPNGTYWNVLAQAGTNGTDVGTTLTTQGDILYRDGSGLQRLAAGTSGQVLKTQGSGANPVWAADAGGKILQYKHVIDATNRSTTSASYTQASSGLQLSITPSATSSKIFILANFTAGYNAQNNRANYSFHRDISGGAQNTELAYSAAGFASLENRDGFSNEQPIAYAYVDSPNTTSACTYYTVMKAEGGNTAYMGKAGATGHFFLMELDGS
jgi:hypothetical protein